MTQEREALLRRLAADLDVPAEVLELQTDNHYETWMPKLPGGRVTPLDEATRLRAANALTEATVKGFNKIEALHRAQLLWTPRRERETRVKTLKFIVKEMNTWRPAEFMRSINRSTSSGTPADMHRAVVAWIEKHIKAIEEAP